MANPAADDRRWWAAGWALIAVGALLAGWLAPVADPDVPMHLAIGEWILAHGRVPFTEPFAWTRAGEPFYAYSWLPQAAYALAHRSGGGDGLRALHALEFLGAALAAAAFARAARWGRWQALLLVTLHLALGGVLALSPVRPQTLLLVWVPLAWAAGYRLRDDDRPLLAVVSLYAISALAANTHLFFPLTAAPLALLLGADRVDRRRFFLGVLACGLGWLTSPYALHWIDVFGLNFAPNALLAYPSPIDELTPGFTAALFGPKGLLAQALLLSAIGVTFASRPAPARLRVLFFLMWFCGLLLFGVGRRGVVVWWLLVLPQSRVLLELLPVPRSRGPVRQTLILGPLVLVLSVIARSRDPIVPRALEAAPVAEWLACHASTAVPGRIVTVFNYGSLLTWRLPWLSSSIDGRTIFPDSVALPEAFRLVRAGPPELGPWRSADLAIVPRAMPVASVLDTAAGWSRLQPPMTADVGVWARDDWWARARRTVPMPCAPPGAARR